MSILTFISYTIILIIITVAIYYVYPQSIYYIPEVERLRKASTEVNKLIEQNVSFAETIAKKTGNLEACQLDLAKKNSDLAKAINDLNASKQKYDKLDASVLKFITEDLSDAHKLLIKSTQILLDYHINLNPAVRAAFNKLYLSILDLGVIGTKDICKNKNQIIAMTEAIIHQIQSHPNEGARLCNPDLFKMNLSQLKLNILYEQLMVDPPGWAITPNIVMIEKAPSGRILYGAPRYSTEVTTAIADPKIRINRRAT